MVFTKEQRKAYDAKRPNRRTARGKKLSKFARGFFCTWDGEGAKINGIHKSIMFLGSEGHSLIKAEGLKSSEMIPFLMDAAKDLPTYTINVGFALHYDVNMILSTLKHDTIEKIMKDETDYGTDIRLKGRLFNIRYRRGREFIIREFDPVRRRQWIKNKRTGKYRRKAMATFRLWDIWGFFQCSLVNAISEWLTLSDEDKAELKIIAEHKGQRSHFDPKEIDDIAAYCRKELAFTLRLCRQLHHDLIDAEITLRRWDGTGAIASAVMEQHKIKLYKSPRDDDLPNSAIQHAARMGYAGARIQQLQIGHTTKTCHHYDQCSAYPSKMPDLPCLKCGHWEWATTFEPDSFGIWDVTWDYRATYAQRPWAPFPFFFRTSDGSLFYPPAGQGQYWTPEVASALKNQGPGDRLIIGGGYVYRPGCSDKPFAYIRQMYTMRQLWKSTCHVCGSRLEKNDWCPTCNTKSRGRGGQRVLKGAMCSHYGKLAQQLGARPPNLKKGETEWKIPATHELLWAGYITAATRANLYDVAMLEPDHCIMIQTDGITFDVDIADRLDIGSGLGQWEVKAPWLETLAIQPGIYMARTGPDPANMGHWTIHYRGFDKGQLYPQLVLDAWRNKVIDLSVDTTRFVGAGTCIATGDWSDFCQWPKRPRSCNIFPTRLVRTPTGSLTKRKASRYVDGSGDSYQNLYGLNPADGMLPLACTEVPEGKKSKPHDLIWMHGQEDAADFDQRCEDGVPLWLANYEHAAGLE